MESVAVRIGGANGDGIDSAGLMLARIFKRMGYNIFAFRGYQSVIRGGVVWYQVRISNERLYSYGNEIDLLIALSREAVQQSIALLKESGVLIYDSNIGNVAAKQGINSCPFRLLN